MDIGLARVLPGQRGAGRREAIRNNSAEVGTQFAPIWGAGLRVCTLCTGAAIYLVLFGKSTSGEVAAMIGMAVALLILMIAASALRRSQRWTSMPTTSQVDGSRDGTPGLDRRVA